jgi:hypothetical protein
MIVLVSGSDTLSTISGGAGGATAGRDTVPTVSGGASIF